MAVNEPRDPTPTPGDDPEAVAAGLPGGEDPVAGAPLGGSGFEDDAPFEVVIEEDVVPIGQIDFRDFLRYKEAVAARAGAPEADTFDPVASLAGTSLGGPPLHRSVTTGVLSLLKITGGISVAVAAGYLALTSFTDFGKTPQAGRASTAPVRPLAATDRGERPIEVEVVRSPAGEPPASTATPRAAATPKVERLSTTTAVKAALAAARAARAAAEATAAASAPPTVIPTPVPVPMPAPPPAPAAPRASPALAFAAGAAVNEARAAARAAAEDARAKREALASAAKAAARTAGEAGKAADTDEPPTTVVVVPVGPKPTDEGRAPTIPAAATGPGPGQEPGTGAGGQAEKLVPDPKTIEEARALEAKDPAAARRAYEAIASGLEAERGARGEGARAMSDAEKEARFAAAILAYRSGDPRAARRHLEALREASPFDVRVLNNLALAVAAEGEPDRAEALLKEALAVDPRFVPAYANLGNIHLGRGAVELAELHYRRALRLDDTYAPAHVGLALALERRGFHAQAEEAARVYLGTPEGKQGPYGHALLGRLLLRQEKYAEARASLGRALEAAPRDPAVLNDLGTLEIEEGHLDAAVRTLGRAIEADVHRPSSYSNRGRAYAALGDREKGAAAEALYLKAKADYEKALDLEPGYPDAHYNFALLAERFGQYVLAREEYERALELDPTHARTLNNLGLLYRRAAEEKDTKPASRESWLLQAVDLFERATRADARFAEPHWNRGVALAALGRRGEALSAFERYASLLPPGAAGDERRRAVREATDRLRAGR